MPFALILADDLTGAADTGAQFARQGLNTLLALQPGATMRADVWGLTSESRALSSAADAAAAVCTTLGEISFAEYALIYKKIDSTLRGHPGAELRAMRSMVGDLGVVLAAPAFPAQGRTTLGGIMQVRGVPLEQTSFAAEAGSGDLREALGGPAALLPLEIVRAGPQRLRQALAQAAGLLIADAENDDDLRALARAARLAGVRVFCGSAGLAAALAEESGAAGAALLARSPAAGRPPLAVIGSLHAASAAQVAAARRQGWQVITPPENFFQTAGAQGIAETAAQLAKELAAGRAAVLATSPLPGGARLMPQEVARKLAAASQLALQSVSIGGFFLTGGDTARAVCAALGCRHLRLGGEVEPGMPWAQMVDGRFSGLEVVSKAGGFGGETALLKALAFLVNA